MIRLISKYRSFQSKASGGTLFEQVCKQLNLLETDYFGLEYNDNRGATVSRIYYLILTGKTKFCGWKKTLQIVDPFGDKCFNFHIFSISSPVGENPQSKQHQMIMISFSTGWIETNL